MGWFTKSTKGKWEQAASALQTATNCPSTASPSEVCRAIKTTADARDAYVVALERSNNALARTTKKLDEAESKVAVLREIIDRTLAAIDFPKDFDVSQLPEALKDQTEKLWDLAQKRAKQENVLANTTHKLEALQKAHEALQKTADTFRQEVVAAATSGQVTDTTYTGAVNMVKDVKRGLETSSQRETFWGAKFKELSDTCKDVRDKFAQFRSHVASALALTEDQVIGFNSYDWVAAIAKLRNKAQQCTNEAQNLQAELRAMSTQNDALRADVRKLEEVHTKFLQATAEGLGLSEEEVADLKEANGPQYLLDTIKIVKAAVGSWQGESDRWRKDYFKACNTYGALNKALQAQMDTWTTKCQCLEIDKQLLMGFQDTLLEVLGRPQPGPTKPEAKAYDWIVDLVRERLEAGNSQVQEEFFRWQKECALALGYSEDSSTAILADKGPKFVLEGITGLKKTATAWEEAATGLSKMNAELEKKVSEMDNSTKTYKERFKTFIERVRSILLFPEKWNNEQFLVMIYDGTCIKLRDSIVEDAKRKTMLLFEFPV